MREGLSGAGLVFKLIVNIIFSFIELKIELGEHLYHKYSELLHPFIEIW